MFICFSAIIILIFGIIKFFPVKKKIQNRKLIQMITEISIFTAIGLVLDYVSSVIGIAPWPNGGSISIAMIPIFIMGYRWGLSGGLITGLLMGIIQMMWSNYLVHPIIPLFDYILPYTVLGLIGLFKKQATSPKFYMRLIFIPLSIVVVCFLRLVFHTISGMVAWNTGFIASVIYNLSYLGFNVILCSVLMVILSCFLKNYFKPQHLY